MQFMTTEYVESLHSNGLRPYTQHVEINKDTIDWVITTLTKEAKENIIDKIIISNPNEISCILGEESI